MKSEITDLEAEIIKLKKKCEHLELVVQTNDTCTPRRTELRKRILHESPAPEIPTSPFPEEVNKFNLKKNIGLLGN